MNEVCNHKEAETITRHSNQYHATQYWPCWHSWEMWHAELMMWCLLSDLLSPQSNSCQNSMDSIVWTAKYCTLFWDFFHSNQFMRRMVFYMSLSAIFINLDKDTCHNDDRIFCTKMIMETDIFFISYKNIIQ